MSLQLLIIAGVEFTLAALVAWSTWRDAWLALKYLTAQHDGGLGYRLVGLDGWVTAVVPISAAVVLFGAAIGLLARVKAAVGVGLIAAVSVVFGLGVVAHRSTAQLATLVVAVIAALALALAALTGSLPVHRDHYAARRVAAGYSAVLGWVFIGLGVGPIGIPNGILGGAGFHMRAIGIIEVAFAVGLLLVVRAVRRGNATARPIATVLLVVLAATLAMGQRWDRPHLKFLPLGTLVVIAACVCAAVAIWIRPNQSAADLETGGPIASSRGLWFAFGLGGAIPAIAAVMLVLPNHSQDNSFAAQDVPTATPTYEEPTPTPVAVQPMGRSWTISLTREGGYSVQAVVSVGAPEHFTNGLTNGQDVAGSACGIDAESDAVLPFSVELRNTTTGFSTGGGLRLGLSPNAGLSASPIEAEMYYTAGPQCSTRSSVAIQSTQPLQPGGATLGNGFLVVHDYYTPNTPNGDTSLLVDNPLVISQSQSWSADDGTSEEFTVTDITGFGVSTGYDGWVLPLPVSVGS